MAARGCWNNLTTLQRAAVVLGIPAGAAVCYILYRRYRESRGGCRSPLGGQSALRA
uniref:Uncharacterized protein n=1 Tax=Strix occidentalis caurina TaxID=311401 RepID=A0A8D0KXX0_STROC